MERSNFENSIENESYALNLSLVENAPVEATGKNSWNHIFSSIFTNQVLG